MDTTIDTATAYHEAGHAVVALALGRPVHKVSILADQVHLGHCEFRKGNIKPTDDWLEREMLIALGGLAAEAIFTGHYAWAQARKDLIYVQRLAEQRGGEKGAQKIARRALSKVEHLLSQESHWQAVQVIAAELLRVKTISGRSARHLFEESCREP